ncbi:caspase-8-like [Littorina saxatilis]|uniref:caspase-8-like n=1 Tax=Littorina saxatilis TaxID=31220 RepID=UPI0038B51B5C
MCLIIDNQTFQKDKTKAEAKELKDRQGSDADRDALKATFEEMLFEVRCLDNLPEKKMLRTLNKLAEEDHSKFDCFACCILSYGEPGVVFGSNGMPVKILSLTSALKKKNCPTLEGKPKVFFIHACPVVQAEPEDDHGEDVDTAATRITGGEYGVMLET